MKFNKLVRDKIPEKIRAEGREPITHIAESEEYRVKLNEKLQEEVSEYLESENAEELADILEVIDAIIELKGLTKEEVATMKQKKFDERGGFAGRIILDET